MLNKWPYIIAILVEVFALMFMWKVRNNFELLILTLVIVNSLLHMCTDFMENPQKKFFSAGFRLLSILVVVLVYSMRSI